VRAAFTIRCREGPLAKKRGVGGGSHRVPLAPSRQRAAPTAPASHTTHPARRTAARTPPLHLLRNPGPPPSRRGIPESVVCPRRPGLRPGPVGGGAWGPSPPSSSPFPPGSAREHGSPPRLPPVSFGFPTSNGKDRLLRPAGQEPPANQLGVRGRLCAATQGRATPLPHSLTIR
jgi:hypothetical protein